MELSPTLPNGQGVALPITPCSKRYRVFKFLSYVQMFSIDSKEKHIGQRAEVFKYLLDKAISCYSLVLDSYHLECYMLF